MSKILDIRNDKRTVTFLIENPQSKKPRKIILSKEHFPKLKAAQDVDMRQWKQLGGYDQAPLGVHFPTLDEDINLEMYFHERVDRMRCLDPSDIKLTHYE